MVTILGSNGDSISNSQYNSWSFILLVLNQKGAYGHCIMPSKVHIVATYQSVIITSIINFTNRDTMHICYLHNNALTSKNMVISYVF